MLNDKGFGFITAEDGKEYFFHQSGVNYNFDHLKKGMSVTFEPGEGLKGPRAEDVEVV